MHLTEVIVELARHRDQGHVGAHPGRPARQATAPCVTKNVGRAARTPVAHARAAHAAHAGSNRRRIHITQAIHAAFAGNAHAAHAAAAAFHIVARVVAIATDDLFSPAHAAHPDPLACAERRDVCLVVAADVLVVPRRCPCCCPRCRRRSRCPHCRPCPRCRSRRRRSRRRRRCHRRCSHLFRRQSRWSSRARRQSSRRRSCRRLRSRRISRHTLRRHKARRDAKPPQRAVRHGCQPAARASSCNHPASILLSKVDPGCCDQPPRRRR